MYGVRQFGHGWCPPEFLVQPVDGAPDFEEELLQPPGGSHRPPSITKVPLQLTDDARGGKCAEHAAPFGVEALGGPDKRQ
jgi:hypothetical protein